MKSCLIITYGLLLMCGGDSVCRPLTVFWCFCELGPLLGGDFPSQWESAGAVPKRVRACTSANLAWTSSVKPSFVPPGSVHPGEMADTDVPMKKRKFNVSEAKRWADKARAKTRVNIGVAFTCFRTLKERLGMYSDVELACFLLDR